MKKDIEWLKGRFRGRKIFKPQNAREIGYNMAIDEFSEYVDRLDQMDNREQLEKAYKDILERGEFWFDDKKYVVVETVDITEEQVMKWLDNNDFYDHRTAETVLANAVDKGELGYYGTKYSVVEKPVIPKFVADILEENTFADLPTAFEELLSANAGHYYGEGVCKWIVSNEETFARAWLDGYEVEEEQKYIVPVIKNLYLKQSESGDFGVGSIPSEMKYEFTEQEIKDYDERYLAFKVPVEELEEDV